MARFSDSGILLSYQSYGENKKIVSIFTQKKGLVKAIFHQTKRTDKGLNLIGNLVSCVWNARLEAHLGTWMLEILDNRAYAYLLNSSLLNAVTYMSSLLHRVLPERHPYEPFFFSVDAVLKTLSVETLPNSLLFFELSLLRELGFEINMQQCAVTGKTEEITWISPKTGRAVTREVGDPYKDKLFYIPEVLKRLTLYRDLSEFLQVTVDQKDQKDIAVITGYFIERFFSDIPKISDLLIIRAKLLKGVYQ